MKTQESELKYIKAKSKVEKTKSFYTHVFIYLIVNLIITAFKVSDNLDSWSSFTNELLSFNVLSSWTIWGLFIVMHFISFVFGQRWEERKIEELMNKELSKNSKK